MGNIFMISSELTKIKNLDDCKKILKSINNNGGKLIFAIENGSKVMVSKSEDHEGSYELVYFTGQIDWKTPTFLDDEEGSAKTLYRLRKYYHEMWED